MAYTYNTNSMRTVDFFQRFCVDMNAYFSCQLELADKNTPLRKIPKSFQNVIQIEACQLHLDSKFIQERNKKF